MNLKALTVCKTFIQYCGNEDLKSLLPQEIQERLQEIQIPASLKKETFFEDFFNKIHFSWFAPYLRTFSEKEISFFLNAFDSPQREQLCRLLRFTHTLSPISPLGSNFLRKKMLEQLKSKQEILPLSFIPEHPLNPLLEIPYEVLADLPFYLGLHDLAFEMRQIIATEALKELFQVLSKKEAEMLNLLLLHKEPLVFERLFLENWDGSREELQKLLEVRGLNRLGVALYGSCLSLQWYLTHRFSMHQAALILKYCEKPTHIRAGEILNEQISKSLEFLHKS